MKISLLLFFFCVLTVTDTRGQAWKKELESSIEMLYAAMINPDRAKLEKITAAELSFGHSTGQIENKSEFIQDVLSGPVKFNSISVDGQNINLAGDVAIVRNNSSIKGVKEGAPLDLKIGVLMIWKKQGTQWQLLARQGFKLP
jgi:hypothetical protein